MDGLKYILGEIEARRNLLHDFAKSIKSSREFTLFDGGIPDFVKNRELIYRPNTEDEPYESLTVEVFNDLYKKQFRNLRQWSRLSIPLKPGDSLPKNYEVNEVLAYELGGGHCTAYILTQLWSPSLQQPDRWFYVYVEHRYIPGQRYPQKRAIDVNAVRRILGKNVPEYPEYKDCAVITPSVYRYNWWKKGARKARPRLNPVDNRADIDAGAYWIEEDKIFTSPIIVIDEETSKEQIWGQLLFHALGYGYFRQNSPEENNASSELRRLLLPKKYKYLPEDKVPNHVNDRITDTIMYLRKHALSPYDARSNLAYVKRLLKVFGREKKDSYLPKSIPWAHQETGIPIRTIYNLVREGKLKKAADSSKKGVDAGDIMILSDDAIEKLKQRKKRKDIYQLAGIKGKSRKATKKWLQRHRDLPEDDFKDSFKRWLNKSNANKREDIK